MSRKPGGIQTALMVAGGYVGAVVGGGFATGRELLHFFIVPTEGSPAIVGAVAGGFVLGGVLLMLAVLRNGGDSRGGAAALFCPEGPQRTGVDVLLLCFFWAVLAVVLSAAAALAASEGLHPLSGTLATGLIAGVVVLTGRRAGTAVNALLAVVLLATVFRVQLAYPAAAGRTGVPPAALLLYVSYNLLFPLAVFPGFAHRGRAGACLAGAALGGLFLGGLCWAATLLMARVYRHVAGAQVPLRVALALVAPRLGGIYPLIAGLALLTTAVALTQGLAARLSTRGRPNARTVCAVLLPAALGARVSLVELVATVYPAMAWISLLLWLQLARRWIRPGG